jgi:PAS domain S-box-containing protein
MPNTNSSEADIALARLRQILEEHNASLVEIPISLSCGVSTAETKAPLVEFLKKADENMYLEKRGKSAHKKWAEFPIENNYSRKKPNESPILPISNQEIRLQAERGAQQSSPEDFAKLSPDEIQHTLHELRVHQIELEMQNEELRRTHLELEAAHERYFDLYDLAPVGYFTINERGLILEANLTAGKMLGMSRGELNKQIFSQLIFKEDQDSYYHHRKLLFEKKESQNFELRMIRKVGLAFWTYLSATIVQDLDGAPICRMTLIDINERKQKEAELLRWEKIFQLAEWGIIVGNSDGKTIEFMNPTFAKMHGYTIEVLSSWAISDLFAADCRADIVPNMQLANQMGHHLWESRHIHKDGHTFPVLIDVTAVKDEKGKVLYRVVNVQDITERKHNEDQILELNRDLEQRVLDRTARLESANKELDSFSYSVAHDLRAPLRSIDGYSQALKEDYEDKLDDKGKKYINYIRDGTTHMANLIEGLLQLSRYSRLEMNLESVDLSALAQEIWSRLENNNELLSYEFIIQPGLVDLADRNLITIVLTNLISNAEKFTSKTDHPLIEFGKTKINGESPFFIRDNGAGFDMSFAKNLFGAFQRMHKQSEFPGTGIGLSTVQRIINRHGGKVWAEAKINQGATFYFTLLEDKRI